jgi:hypothetical protein
MRRACCSIVGLALAVPQYSCHAPTAQESYAASKRCFVVLDTGLKIIPGLRSGAESSSVRIAADGDLSSAWDGGKALGMTGADISADLEKARAGYFREAQSQPGAVRRDVDECLGDFYGGPND